MSGEDRSPYPLRAAPLGVLCALLAACGSEEVEQPEALDTKKYATGFSAPSIVRRRRLNAATFDASLGGGTLGMQETIPRFGRTAAKGHPNKQ